MKYPGFDGTVCLKLFSEEWKDAYEREAAAYALMIHRGVKRCIPTVYWVGELSLSQWNGKERKEEDGDEHDNEIYYGIVMEYFENFREVDFESIDLPTAMAVARALNRIHEARIYHGDMEERNILLVRESRVVRAVWIDFSCAWINAYGTTLDREWGSLMAEFDFRGVSISMTYAEGTRILIFSLMKSSKT